MKSLWFWFETNVPNCYFNAILANAINNFPIIKKKNYWNSALSHTYWLLNWERLELPFTYLLSPNTTILRLFPTGGVRCSPVALYSVTVYGQIFCLNYLFVLFSAVTVSHGNNETDLLDDKAEALSCVMSVFPALVFCLHLGKWGCLGREHLYPVLTVTRSWLNVRSLVNQKLGWIKEVVFFDCWWQNIYFLKVTVKPKLYFHCWTQPEKSTAAHLQINTQHLNMKV